MNAEAAAKASVMLLRPERLQRQAEEKRRQEDRQLEMSHHSQISDVAESEEEEIAKKKEAEEAAAARKKLFRTKKQIQAEEEEERRKACSASVRLEFSPGASSKTRGRVWLRHRRWFREGPAIVLTAWSGKARRLAFKKAHRATLSLRRTTCAFDDMGVMGVVS